MPATTPQFEAALAILSTLREADYEAYLAGGCVRDLLLGREPQDYDVATSATPDVVLAMLCVEKCRCRLTPKLTATCTGMAM